MNYYIYYNADSGIIGAVSASPISINQDFDLLQADVNPIDVKNLSRDYIVQNSQLVVREDRDQLIQQQRLNQIRRIRDAFLAMSDWTQIADTNLTTQQQAAWADYRQQLRDITDILPTPIPEDYQPTWPEKPV
jgi:hypothetical protein